MGRDTQLEVRFPGSVPSRTEFYDVFNGGWKGRNYENAWSTGRENELKGKLSGYEGLFGFLSRIIDAYCYAGSMNGRPKFKDAPCSFFYYWMKNTVPGGSDTAELSHVLGNIYNTLNDAPYENKCDLKYGDVLWTQFDRMKEVHDFAYDYDTIQSLVGGCQPADCSKYLLYLQGIKSACTLAGAGCDSVRHGPGTYCYDYNEKYKNFCEQNKQELIPLCIQRKNPNPNQASSSGSFSDNDQGCLENLPSKLGYSIFDAGAECSMKNEIWDKEIDISNKLRPILTKYGNIQNDIDNIAKGWCYVLNGATGSKESGYKVEGDLYYLFYYWLGHKVWNSKGQGNEFSDVMNEIYFQLQTVFPGIHRGPTCTKCDQSEFGQMRKVFDYYYDHGTIKECIQESQTSVPNCTEQYSKYLQEAAEVYGKMKQYCDQGGPSRNICCKHFKEISNPTGGNNIPEPSKLKSELESLTRSRRSKAGTISSPTNNNNTAPIVSFALGLVGLPALALFLYKYNLLPSWISNNLFFGGGVGSTSSRSNRNRKKRSGAKNWDTLTDNDSTTNSTFDSTDISTVASTSNLSRTTTDNSTIYDGRPPTRGRKNNARGHRSVVHQRNIGYQNM
ncbi:KIR protein [Plasmodium coatneyi]|uniref:KIR protein n=1 Tax=Plasmodium coatneyi TaxID=208452 RepID=A0A1B1E7Y9_9APIC|nr:KIR protein [Plasmodium coatneyi]ANQ11136.1 KIR protein [Plasmodium coatneyi]